MAIEMDIHSDLAIPPGEYLEEVLEDLGMTKDELAKRMGRPAPKLSAIFKGGKAITPDTALQLEKVVGVPAHIWTGLESEYRLTLARQAELKEEARLKEETGLVTAFCYKELARLGKVKATRAGVERVRELHSYLGVTSLRSVEDVTRYAVAFRAALGGKRQPSREAIASWLRIGETEARNVECGSFNADELRAALPALRSMTKQDASRFMPGLRRSLAETGVALVLCPHFPKTFLHGATFWAGSEKAVIMMSIRGKWADIFWFSLFHEFGHVLLHGRNELFLEISDGSSGKNKKEGEADRFAADTLIPRDRYREFVSRGRFSSTAVAEAAGEIGVHAGILVGRLQNDKHLNHGWLNRLRVKYEWVEQQRAHRQKRKSPETHTVG